MCDACYNRGAPLFSQPEILEFGSSRRLPETDLEKNKTATGWKIPWPRYTARIVQKKWPISDDFG